MIPSALQAPFDADSRVIVYLAPRVRDKLLAFCEENGFAYQGRVKDLPSVAAKVETGRFASWKALDDLFACTIIVPTLREEPHCLVFLRENFEEVSIKPRGAARKRPEEFRYDSTRFIARLRSREPSVFSQVPFEVQVRTAFEHAWSVATHSITYKGQTTDWKRLRLTAQLKAAAEQLDLLILGFESAAPNIAESPWPELQLRAAIEDFFKTLATDRQIPEESWPSGWTRFAESVAKILQEAPGYNRREPTEIVARAREALTNEMALLASSSFPRSISLCQFAFGTFVKHGLVPLELRQYIPLITPELVELFPDVSGVSPKFELTPHVQRDRGQ